MLAVRQSTAGGRNQRCLLHEWTVSYWRFSDALGVVRYW